MIFAVANLRESEFNRKKPGKVAVGINLKLLFIMFCLFDENISLAHLLGIFYFLS